jgi:TorA maturation chaperone TorD
MGRIAPDSPAPATAPHSPWRHIPAEQNLLRPDPEAAHGAAAEGDSTDTARSEEYALLAALLLRPPDAGMLERLSRLQGTPTPLGLAHTGLARAAASATAEAVDREYFDLFIGVGRGELLPYASYYLTGFLNEAPLVRLREELGSLGIERAEGYFDPEDHIGTLCEIMSGLADGAFAATDSDQAGFFARHLVPWAGRFFADLERANAATFYKAVGAVGRVFVDIETEGFAMEARGRMTS